MNTSDPKKPAPSSNPSSGEKILIHSLVPPTNNHPAPPPKPNPQGKK